MSTKNRNKILVYFLASPEEEDECLAIRKHLTPIIRNSKIPIEINSDFEITAGEDKEKHKLKLYKADLVLALISADFIDDDETYKRTKKVIERYNKGETILLPILVRNCMWKSTPFVNLTLLPKNLQPINNKQYWNSEDDALMAVVEDIYAFINEFTFEEKIELPVADTIKNTNEQKVNTLIVEPEKSIEKSIDSAAAFKIEDAPEIKTESPTIIVEQKAAVEQSQSNANYDKKSFYADFINHLNDFTTIKVNWRRKYYFNVIWKRTAALVLDLVLTFIPLLIIAVFIFEQLADFGIGKGLELGSGLMLFILFPPFLCIIVCSILECSKLRGTFGKLILKIQITDSESNPISFFKSLWRNILRVLYGCILIAGPICLIKFVSDINGSDWAFIFGLLFIVLLLIQFFTFRKTKKLIHDNLSFTVIGEKLKKS